VTDNRLSEMMTSAVADANVPPNLAHQALAGGKRRLRRRRRVMAGVAAAGLTGVVVALSVVGTGTTTGGTARLVPAGPVAPASPATTVTPRPTATTCSSTLPTAWTSRLEAGKVPLAASLSVLPFAISPDGIHVYASVWEPGWSGVAAINRDGTLQKIHTYSPDTAEAFWGDASDHDLVWVESHSSTDLSSTMFTWNATTGKVDELNPTPAAGTPITNSQTLPVVQGNHVTWVDNVDGNHNRVHLYDLTSHTDRVVFTGPAASSTLAGDWLVWTGGEPNQPAKLHLVDVNNGHALPTPTALDKVTGVASVAGSDGALTWVGPDNIVYTWKTGMAKPQKLFDAGATGDSAQHLSASGRYVVWNGSSSAHIADVTSGGVATLSTTPVVQGTFVVLTTGEANTGKDAHPIRQVNVLDTAGLPALPRC
jgi:hypothetical protein